MYVTFTYRESYDHHPDVQTCSYCFFLSAKMQWNLQYSPKHSVCKNITNVTKPRSCFHPSKNMLRLITAKWGSFWIWGVMAPNTFWCNSQLKICKSVTVLPACTKGPCINRQNLCCFTIVTIRDGCNWNKNWSRKKLGLPDTTLSGKSSRFFSMALFDFRTAGWELPGSLGVQPPVLFLTPHFTFSTAPWGVGRYPPPPSTFCTCSTAPNE